MNSALPRPKKRPKRRFRRWMRRVRRVWRPPRRGLRPVPGAGSVNN